MFRLLAFLSLILLLPACAEVELASHMAKRASPGDMPAPTGQPSQFKVGTPYKVNGNWYYPKEQYEMVESGIASWYGPGFHGKKTANGETFDSRELTAAHRTLQMPSLVRVTNLDNGKSIIVRINDRGPFKRGRVIDLSERAAELLEFKHAGTAKVKLEVLKDESLRIADMARAGHSTRGYEMAMNGKAPATKRGVRTPPVDGAYQTASLQNVTATPVAPVQSEILSASTSAQTGLQPSIPGHSRDGRFYPDPVVTEMPVVRTGIYIQAGSFSVEDNARRLSERLAHYGTSQVHSAVVNGQTFYRVRIGPIARVEEADEMLARVMAAGENRAMIVVE